MHFLFMKLVVVQFFFMKLVVVQVFFKQQRNDFPPLQT